MTDAPDRTTMGSRRPAPFVRLHRSSLIKEGVAFAIMVCAMAVSRWSALWHLQEGFIGGTEGDGGLYVWLTSALPLNLSLPWFSTHAFYPYSYSLAFSDNFLLPSLLVHALMAAGLPLVVAYNLLFLGAGVLNGYCCYRLIWTLSGMWWPAVWGGVAFLSQGYFTVHLGHPQLQWAFFLPLALSLLFRFLAAPTITSAIAIGLSATLTLLCSVYYFIFLLLLLLIVATTLLILRGRTLAKTRKNLLLPIGVAIGLLPAIPCIIPYMAIEAMLGARSLHEAFTFAMTPLGYFSSSGSLLYGTLNPIGAGEEAQMFPGVIVVALLMLAGLRMIGAPTLRNTAIGFVAFAVMALVCVEHALPLSPPIAAVVSAALCWVALLLAGLHLFRLGAAERALGFDRITDRDLIAVALMLAIIGVLLSFGPLGTPVQDTPALGVYAALYQLIPGLSGIRALARFALLAQLGAIIAGSLWLAHFARSRPTLRWIVPLLALASLLEEIPNSATIFQPLERPRYVQPLSAPPEAVHALPKERDGALIILPFSSISRGDAPPSWSRDGSMQIRAMQISAQLNRPVVNGYSGVITKMMRDLPREVRQFPSIRAATALSKIAGLKFVLVVPSLNPQFDRIAFEQALQEHSALFKVLHRDSDGNVLLENTFAPSLDQPFELLVLAQPLPQLNLTLTAERQGSHCSISLPSLAPGATLASIAPHQGITPLSLQLPEPTDLIRPITPIISCSGNGSVRLKSATLSYTGSAQ